MSRRKVLCFVPTYNCARQIPRVVASLARLPVGVFDETIIIDNRSADGTVEAALAELNRCSVEGVRVVRNRENLGLGGTHKAAFEYALRNSFTHVLILHGDDQAEIQDMLPVLEAAQLPDGFVMGARFAPGARRIGYGLIKTFGNFVFCFLASVLFRRKIYDFGGSGLNLFSTHALRRPLIARFREFPNNLTFHVFLLGAALFDGIAVRFVPISWREEDQISNVKAFRQGGFLLKLMGELVWSGSAALFAHGPPPLEYLFDELPDRER